MDQVVERERRYARAMKQIRNVLSWLLIGVVIVWAAAFWLGVVLTSDTWWPVIGTTIFLAIAVPFLFALVDFLLSPRQPTVTGVLAREQRRDGTP